MSVSFNDFVGKMVEQCYINDSKDTMFWKVGGKWYKIDAIGDCCSYSWFEHCDNSDALIGGTPLQVENVDGDSFTADDGYNEIQVNMIKFKTDKGYCTIEFRNESNGYYSGWTVISEYTGEPAGLKVLGDM